ncbi:Release factor glutamine methyltransferase [Alphaproteobacteria bacterium SO-S41]|nr:Release factor glutamine methyltransferase [Alphaproteobacteria bacterium SO-S41]
MSGNPDLFETALREIGASFARQPDKPEETPEGTVKALWLAAAGTPLSVEAASEVALPLLDETQAMMLNELVIRRIAGLPLAHLTGRQRFMGLDFIAGPDALVPRKETELLGGLALARLAGIAGPRAIDVCTGSGNLAVALAATTPGAVVDAADLSAEAVAMARRNAALHGVEGRVTFHVGDLFDALPRAALAGAADLVVCNPPYISSAKVEGMPEEISKYEPRMAFDGGTFGLSIVGRLIKEAPLFLKRGGWLCFEIGKGQGPYWLKALGRMTIYGAVETAADADGDVRALAARVS